MIKINRVQADSKNTSNINTINIYTSNTSDVINLIFFDDLNGDQSFELGILSNNQVNIIYI